jgi:hypothetical protein
MAKQKQKYTGDQALTSLLGAINSCITAEKAKVNTNLTVDQQVDAVNTSLDEAAKALDVIGNSNVRTVLQLQDDAVADYHENQDALESAQANGELEAAQALVATAQQRVDALPAAQDTEAAQAQE